MEITTKTNFMNKVVPSVRIPNPAQKLKRQIDFCNYSNCETHCKSCIFGGSSKKEFGIWIINRRLTS